MALKKAGFLAYLKKAFLNHWNLLLFGAGVVGGVLSGHADVVLPMVAAGEMVYLAGLASHPKFQAHVEAQAHKENKAQVKEETIKRIFETLDPRSRARFEELRARCRNLGSLADGIRADGIGDVQSLHKEGINKLLWVFLKLLYSKRSLERFLQTTDEKEIQETAKRIQARTDSLGPEPEDTPEETKMRRTLQDTLASAQMRLENLARANANYEFILLELDRIDAKITSIAELAVNRQDPDFITSEVDGVASTMEQTERAMSELQFLSGLDDSETIPPSFVGEELEKS